MTITETDLFPSPRRDLGRKKTAAHRDITHRRHRKTKILLLTIHHVGFDDARVLRKENKLETRRR